MVYLWAAITTNNIAMLDVPRLDRGGNLRRFISEEANVGAVVGEFKETDPPTLSSPHVLLLFFLPVSSRFFKGVSSFKPPVEVLH